MTTVLWAGFAAGAHATTVDPAPPAAQQVATEVRRYLWRQGFPTYDQPMWVTDRIDSVYYPSSMVTAVASSWGPVVNRYTLTGTDWRYTLAGILIHEYLHGMRDVTEYASLTPGERAVEEGAVEAAAQDLLPRFACAVWRDCNPTGWWVAGESSGDYARFVAMVRGVSRRATGKPVTSAAARTWRYRLVNADRDERAAMWAAATGVTR
jgi:hypothetical protein